MIDNRTAGYKRQKRRNSLLTNDGPFPGNNDILQFYAGGGRGELLSRLARHVQNSDDPVVVTGEPGSGKTLLGLVLADQLKHKFSVSRFDFPTLSREALLNFLIREIRPGHAQQQLNQTPSLATLASVVEQSTSITQPVLLLIDTAAVIDNDFVELMDELKSIKLKDYALFNVVVFQPGSSPAGLHADSLPADSLAHVWPWKTYTLRRLSLSEIHDYLQHHMMLFDYNQRNMFTREMSYFIADQSGGVFGLINELARSAILLAGINNSSQVSLSHLVAVSSPRPVRSYRSGGLASISSSGVGFALLVVSIVVLGATLVVMSAN